MYLFASCKIESRGLDSPCKVEVTEFSLMDEVKTLQKINQHYADARAILAARKGIRSAPATGINAMQPPVSSPTEPQASKSNIKPLLHEDQEAVEEILRSTLARAEALPASISKAIKSVSASIRAFHNTVNDAWLQPTLPVPLPPPAGKDERRTALDELRGEIEAPQPKKKKVNKLDEAASSVLLAWVNENLNNPYPSNKEKEELERASGLDQTQINNWLINYRKRKLKQSQA